MVKKTTRHDTPALADLGDGVDAVERGHADVGDDRVGPESQGGLDQFPAVGDDPHQLEFRLQQAANTFGQNPVVVGEQDPRPAHDSAPDQRGLRTDDRRAPDPARSQPKSDPPDQADALSPMLESPSPPRECDLRRVEARGPDPRTVRTSLAVRPDERDAGFPGPGMLDHVPDRFLGDPVDAQGHVPAARRTGTSEAG